MPCGSLPSITSRAVEEERPALAPPYEYDVENIKSHVTGIYLNALT